MGIYIKSNGLSEYRIESGRIRQYNYSTAWTKSTTSYSGLQSGDFNNGTSSMISSLTFNTAGTKVYLTRTGNSNSFIHILECSLSTAWNPSTINLTPSFTVIVPKVTTTYNEVRGIRINDSNGTITIVRRSGADGNDQNHYLTYLMLTAGTLSTASLLSTQLINSSSSSGAGDPKVCYGVHVMSGGEIVAAINTVFTQLSSITSPSGSYFKSIDVGEGGGIGAFHIVDNGTKLYTYSQCGKSHQIDTLYAPTDSIPPSTPSMTIIEKPIGLSINWTDSTDNVAVTGYLLERSVDSGPYAILPTSGTTSLYVDDSAPTGFLEYRVRAFDAAGNYSGYGSDTIFYAGGGPI